MKMTIKQVNLINKFKELKLNYLDFSGYNEIEEHDNEQTHELYFDLFNEFIQPIFDRLDKINYNHEHVIFNFFCEENGQIKGVFYEPQIEIDILSNNYDVEIKNAIELITK
ncbi:hypothetical protein [Mammaliicoccus sp. JADD-157]|uniref:hypothetical protein n=1 Tax=Mammaliicoccus sp. JADD-157 TaxID=3404818 RepID=UPI003BB6E345